MGVWAAWGQIRSRPVAWAHVTETPQTTDPQSVNCSYISNEWNVRSDSASAVKDLPDS